MALAVTTLPSTESAKNALVDDLAALPGISRGYAFQLLDDVEMWSVAHARFIASDVRPLLEPQLKRAVKQALAPSLVAVILFGVATSAVSLATLVSIRKTRRAIERRR